MVMSGKTVTNYEPPFKEPHLNTSQTNMGLPGFYGQVPWASIHRDASNSDFFAIGDVTRNSRQAGLS